MVVGDARGHAGNAGYDDQYDAYYSWDSNVPNHKNLRVGDPIALWDKVRLLGVSVIEEIETSRGSKLLSRCPECGTTRISARKQSVPRFRCMKCRAEFRDPRPDLVQVDLYRARYDAAWTPFDGLLDEREIRALAINSGDINAMRPLDWKAFLRALSVKKAATAVDRVSARLDVSWHDGTEPWLITHGHKQSLVRVRRGQGRFREHLLTAQGNVCAFTGSAPERVLEAGHLYSYAQIGTHYEHGGLMLRRDIHRLFDDGDLAVEPVNLSIDVAPRLASFAQYAQLHDRRLALSPREEQLTWLKLHWEKHRLGRLAV
ncbi:HNH endonuclease [Ornithinimicrobium cerasi]|uniref:HNH endonuclease n=2 Tax=Ornithinimicrobium cerasi TaxID=2248773 RepID=A0A285VE45_9MICO|nr:HNH endonuclease [Ornithinimicrobium cerasi]